MSLIDLNCGLAGHPFPTTHMREKTVPGAFMFSFLSAPKRFSIHHPTRITNRFKWLIVDDDNDGDDVDDDDNDVDG